MSVGFTKIILEKRDSLAKITLNRPQVRNCLDSQILEELESAVEDIESDEAVRVVVLTGAGAAFSSGADLKQLVDATPEQFASYIQLLHRVCNRIENLAKPVIAALNGTTLAGGLELAMACDIRIASEDAQLADHHANIAAIPGGGGSQRLPRLVGISRAKELLFTGKRIDAREAERIGLVNQVAASGGLEEVVDEMVAVLASKSPASLSTMKRLVNHGMQADLKTGLELEILAITQRSFGNPVGKG